MPEGVVPGFQNFTGPAYADLLRLNVADPADRAGQPEPVRAARR